MIRTTIYTLAVASVAVAVLVGSYQAFAARPMGATLANSSSTSAGPPSLTRISLIPKRARCVTRCRKRPLAGYKACVARCVAKKQVCDYGLRNCTKL